MRSLVLVVLLLLASLGVGSPARADDLPAAKAAFKEGKRLFEIGEYRQALERFKTAYLQFDAPALLYNVAQCHVRLGEKREALAVYRSYLQRVPNAPDKVQVEEMIAELERAIQNEPSQPGLVEPMPVVVKPPLYKTPWFWGAVGGGVGLVLILGIGLGVGLRDAPYPAFSQKPTHGTFTF